MESPDRKHRIIVSAYGIILIVWGCLHLVFDYLPESYIKTVLAPVLRPQPTFVEWKWLAYFVVWTGISLYVLPFNLVIGVGLLMRTRWAYYGVVTVMLTLPIHIIISAMWWGAQSIDIQTIALQSFFVILTLVYFSSRPCKTLLLGERRFKLISWVTPFIAIIILVATAPMIVSLWFKTFSDEPFFRDKPQAVTLEQSPTPEVSSQFRQRRLLDVDLMVPDGFVVWHIFSPDGENDWSINLKSSKKDERDSIWLHHDSPADTLRDVTEKHMDFEDYGLKTEFEIEKFFITNNWNPIIIFFRRLNDGTEEKVNYKEIHSNEFKGFLRIRKIKDYMYTQFNLYSNDDTRYIGGSIFSFDIDNNEGLVNTIVSSIHFVEDDDRHDADYYYERGAEGYSMGNFVEAQFEFANAYYLSPDNPEYTYMLAKSLSKAGAKDYKTIQKLAESVLKKIPDHDGAKQLLEEAESNMEDTASEKALGEKEALCEHPFSAPYC